MIKLLLFIVIFGVFTLRSFGDYPIDDHLLFNNFALISNRAADNNIDHIWHNDGGADGAGGTWSFVSDSTMRAGGNSRVHAGHVFMTGASSTNYFAGKIGLGITSPLSELHVKGSVIAENGTTTLPTGRNGGLYAWTDKAFGIELQYQDSDWSLAVVSRIGSDIRFGHYAALETQQGNFDLKMIIDELGNVGIGVNDPTNKLEVAGAIRAEEVIVESGWADFVFEDDYVLMNLEELANYIEKNRSLPDVPKTSEVSQSGVSVGETQALLLRKIEELTLYIIDQDQKLVKQQNQINELLKENSGKD